MVFDGRRTSRARHNFPRLFSPRQADVYRSHCRTPGRWRANGTPSICVQSWWYACCCSSDFSYTWWAAVSWGVGRIVSRSRKLIRFACDKAWMLALVCLPICDSNSINYMSIYLLLLPISTLRRQCNERGHQWLVGGYYPNGADHLSQVFVDQDTQPNGGAGRQAEPHGQRNGQPTGAGDCAQRPRNTAEYCAL